MPAKSRTDGGQATADRIQRASAELFARQGFAATGIREIADTAGLTVSSLYHHFSSKDELLFRIMRDGMQAILDSATDSLGTSDRPTEQLAALTRNHVMTHCRDRFTALVSDQEIRALGKGFWPPISRLRDQYEALWRMVLAQGKEIGEFRIRDVKLTAMALLEMCNSIAHWYREDGPLSPDALADEYAKIIVGFVRGGAE